MTVSVSTRLSQLYVGNNVNKRFDFLFRVFDQEDEDGVSIRLKNSSGFETVDKSLYNVIINEDNLGGYVEFLTPPSVLSFFYVAGETPADQLLDITNYDNFYPDAIERAFDKLTAILQEWSTRLTQETEDRKLKDGDLEQFVKDYVTSILSINTPEAITSVLADIVHTNVLGEDYNQQEFNEFLIELLNTRYPDINSFIDQSQAAFNSFQNETLEAVNLAVADAQFQVDTAIANIPPTVDAAVANTGNMIGVADIAALILITDKSNNQTAMLDSGDIYRFSKPDANPGTWVFTGLNYFIYVNANAIFNPVKLGAAVNLDALKAVGIYFATTVEDATLTNNYPVTGLGGILHVAAAQNSSLIFQEFRAANGVDYWRSWNGSVWTFWKLKIDLSQYEQRSKSFTDLGAITTGTDLNNLQTAGRWSLSDGRSWATAVLNFPVDGFSGTIEVIKNTGSSLILQRAVRWVSSSSVETYIRMYRNGWSVWATTKVDTSSFETVAKAFTDLGLLVADVNLNDLKTVGRYALSDGSVIATTALNYPKAGISGTFEVIKNAASSVITQRFTVHHATAPELWIRVFRNSWSAWIKVGTDLITTNTFKIQSVFSASMLADDLRTEAAVYLVNNNNIDLIAAGLPEKSLGLLKVSKATLSSFAVQEFISASSGKIYTRFWNNVVWSAWASYTTGGGDSGSDLLTFTKTATALQWYVPNSGVGTNKLRHTYNRGINADINRDSWGMGTASVFSGANGLVQNLTTNGVWECAIIDSQNVGDHSGGGHGDEAKFLSYFLVDGIYYPEDFTGTFTAKEVKHIQHSVIYVEGQNIPICTRKTTWTFNKDGNNSKTTLEWAAGRTITKARIAMLPIYRKANQDGTGDQITDTEIRSQDDQVINVAEHGFALRDLAIKDGDSILLSSAVSNISADVRVKKIIAQDPHAYVQNTILYNKVYVNGFMETAAPFVTGANDVWEIETEFVIKVRS